MILGVKERQIIKYHTGAATPIPIKGGIYGRNTILMLQSVLDKIVFIAVRRASYAATVKQTYPIRKAL